ncbi:DUF317 domain-containing protein [Streptomyces sp. NPDC014894]|uniref:DUF317 domain-containing protein n=1 Tax=Streptomyces sp. NPDC014894 TaxID=3364931 RepID=UPI0036FA5C4B
MLKREQLDLFAADHNRFLDDITPRYLAGPGDARHVTHALAAAGWTVQSDPLAPVVDLISPDRRYQLRYTPLPGTPRQGWHLSSRAPGEHWYASFGPVPAEILAGFTDALLLPPPRTALPEVWDVLTTAGWTHTRLPDGDEARSPGGTVHIEKRPICAEIDKTPVWRIEVRPDPKYGPPVWTAWLSQTPPAHLVHGLVSALTDTAPLQRHGHEGHYSARRTKSSVTPQAYARAHRDRIDTVRAQVRAARRQARKALTTAPAPAPPVPSAPVRQAR